MVGEKMVFGWMKRDVGWGWGWGMSWGGWLGGGGVEVVAIFVTLFKFFRQLNLFFSFFFFLWQLILCE